MKFFDYAISSDIIVTVFIINLILLVIAIIGFTNLKKQIRELKTLLNQIQEKQRKIKE